MARFLKISLITILALVLLLAGAVVAVTQLVDPNEFKPQITEAARTQGNMDLRMDGRLAWTFWPSLGVSIGRTEVRPLGDDNLLAAIDSAAVSVAVLPLLWGSVQMDGITLDGLDANLVQTADGANWESLGPPSEDGDSDSAEAPANDSADTPMAIPLTIPSVTVSNSRLRYRDQTTDTDIIIENIAVSASDVSLDAPFPLEASLRYQDQADIRLDLALDTVLSLNLDQSIYRLAPLELDLSVAGITGKPVPVNLTAQVEAALEEDRASVRDLVLTVANTVTRGEITVTQMSARPILAGSLNSDTFDANALLEAIGEAPIETQRADALSKVSLEATLSGPENSAMVKPLVIRLDDSKVTGSAGITDLDSGALAFDLALDRITVDHYLPPEPPEAADTQDQGVASNTASEALLPPLSSDPLLPLDTLRSLTLAGSFSAGSLTYDGIELQQLALSTSAADGLLTLKDFSAQGLEGQLQASASLDARTDTPVIQASQKITGMQVQPLVQMALDEDLFTGVLDLSAQLNATGNSEKALAESARGTVDLALAKGTLRGVNLHNTLVGGINEMLGTYQVLASMIPGQESGKLPTALSRDTEVVQLTARASLKKMVANIDSLNAELTDGTVTGNGFLALRTEQFDLKLGMKAPNLTSNKYLRDQTWPLRCKGNLQGDPADWCGHDKDGFKAIGKSVAAKVATDKVKEKYGIEGEGDTAEEVVKDAAEKRAKEELNEKLEEGLQKLFR